MDKLTIHPKFAEIEINGETLAILNVPFIQQPPQMLCLPYSVSMVIEFFKRTENPKLNIPKLDPEKLAKIMNSDPERGTVLSTTMIKKLNEETDPLEFLMYRGDLNKLDECFQEGKPPILIFNAMYYQTSNEGPAHATVFLGRTDTKIITNNPWMGEYFIYDLGKFMEAWEIEGYRMLIPRIRKTKNTKLDNFTKEEGED